MAASGSELRRVAERQRRNIVANRQASIQRIIRAYELVGDSLQADYKRFQRRWQQAAAEAAKTGVPLDDGWIRRDREFQTLIANYQANLEKAAGTAGKSAAQVAAMAPDMAAAHAAELLAVATQAAVEPAAITAATVEYGPLAQILRDRAPNHVGVVRDILIDAVGRGRSPYDTARLLKRANDGAMTNAITIARTEQMRAYNEAALQSYEQNPAVTQWRWSARCTDRTCAACWAMDGEIFDTDTPLEAHPNCMCVMLPVVDGIDYGQTGAEKFANASADIQEAVLGPAAAAAYQDGALDITDLVRTSTSPEWGTSRSVGSLKDAIGEEAAKTYVASARAARTVQ